MPTFSLTSRFVMDDIMKQALNNPATRAPNKYKDKFVRSKLISQYAPLRLLRPFADSFNSSLWIEVCSFEMQNNTVTQDGNCKTIAHGVKSKSEWISFLTWEAASKQTDVL